MSSTLQAGIMLGCESYVTPKSLRDYYCLQEGVISEELVRILVHHGYTTDYQVFNGPAIFGILDDRQREELRSAIGFDDTKLKLLGNRLRW